MSTKTSIALLLVLALLLTLPNTSTVQAHGQPGQAVAPAAPAASTWYVDRAATGANNGGSWANAYNLLQSALDTAQPGDQIWVAQGVYTPTNTSDCTATFNLKAGVALYGGFDPASRTDTWAERDWENHITVLSGDLEGNDITNANGVLTSTTNITGTNTYHVLSSSGLTQTARLDGFYVTGGKADGSPPHHQGGGMYNATSSPSLANLVFSANLAYWGGGVGNNGFSNPSLVNVTFSGNQGTWGGGMTNWDYSSPSLVNVVFSANQATHAGGLYNVESSPNLVNVVFSANRAAGYGGGMRNDLSYPILVNVTFSANQADRGGGMYNIASNPQIDNCILWGNIALSGAQILNSSDTSIIRYSLVQGGCPSNSTCDHLINADPLFIRPPSPGPDATWGTSDDDAGNLRVQFTSPAIDAGNNTYLPVDALDLDGDGVTTERTPLDLDGGRRFVDIAWVTDKGVTFPPYYPLTVDLGAYEAIAWLLYLPVVIQ